jgi:hypothetical protein
MKKKSIRTAFFNHKRKLANKKKLESIKKSLKKKKGLNLFFTKTNCETVDKQIEEWLDIFLKIAYKLY